MDGEFYVRSKGEAHALTRQKMGPLRADHPIIEQHRCVGCGDHFEGGEYVTLVPVGPGEDPEARERARDGRFYNAIAVPVHWSCATGEEE